MKCLLKDSQYILDIDNNLRENGCTIGRVAEVDNIICYQGNEILYETKVPIFANTKLTDKKIGYINILIPKEYVDIVYKELGETNVKNRYW